MTKKQKKMLLRIILSSIIFISALIVSKGIVKTVLYLISYIIAGYDIVLKAIRNITHLQFFDENFLMLIASLGAFAIKEYPEAVAISLFYQIGELFQSYAVGKSRKSIKDLMNIKPDYANIEKDGEIIKISPEEVKKGDVIIVNSGEKIPLDGIVISGSASVDTSAMTGESLPVFADLGSKVTSGSIALDGMLKIEVTSKFSDSTVSKVLQLITEASEKKSKSENFITAFSKYYTPFVVITAGILGILIPIFFPVNTSEWVRKALVFLVVSCPCALIISVPLSFFGGLGAASKNGILIKGSQYIEALSKACTVIFDKTGTLTKGNYSITELVTENCSENVLMEIATICEAYSNHPIALSLKKSITTNKKADSFKEIAGKGIIAEIDGKIAVTGNDKLFSELNIPIKTIKAIGTVVYVSFDGKYMGHIIFNDEIKKESKFAVSLLKKCGIKKTVLLTGDKKVIGEYVGKKIGIDEIHSELLPQDKVKFAETIKADMAKNKTLIFAGDGINDAPTLAFSDVGIAMGAMGSDAAIEAADVVIMDDNPIRIAAAVMLSKRTMKIAKQNIAISLSVKFFFLIMGALGYAGLWGAVFADVGVMIIAIINAFRTMKSVTVS